MHRTGMAVLGGLLWMSQGVAAGQDVAGIGCSSGDLTLVTGAAFNAACTGDLRIDAARIIEAEESITLYATGNIWMLGTLSAPRKLIAWKRRVAGKWSRTACARGNRKVTLEN